MIRQISFSASILGMLVIGTRCYAVDGAGILLLTGAQQVDLSALDQALIDQQLARVGSSKSKQTYLESIGGSVFYYSAGLKVGVEGHGFLPRTGDESNGITASLSGGYGMLNFGPAYSSDKGFILSPGIGLGGGSMDLKFERTKALDEVLPSDSTTTDDTTTKKLPSSNVNTQFAMASAHLDILFGRDNGGFAFGLRGGYLHSLDGGNWRTSKGDQIGDLPPINVRGPYLKLTLGYGKF